MKSKNTRRNFLSKIGISAIMITASVGTIIEVKASQYTRKKEIDKRIVILFQGDSITDGNRGRNSDPNHIMGHGYAFSIASRLGADFPEKGLRFYNRGIGGNCVSDLAARWQKDTIDLMPNILSILVGVNDVNVIVRSGNSDQAMRKFEATYQSILDQTKAQFPEIILVLCQPFILPVETVKSNWEFWQKEMIKCQEVVANLAKKNDAIYVKFQEVMNRACLKAPAEYWMWDGIHPTVAGHELLAREWIQMVNKQISI